MILCSEQPLTPETHDPPPPKTLEPPHLPQVRELEQRALDVQMLKFGQVIDLELLDRVGATQGTEELKEELREQVGSRVGGQGFLGVVLGY